MKKYIAELLGTFALTLVVALSLAGHFSIPTPFLAALTLGLFVYTVGHISGAHCNPAVTLGAWSIKKISTNTAITYIAFQFIGASLALFLVGLTLGMPTLTVSNAWQIGFSELLGTLFFTFGIASVIYGKAPSMLSGIVVGGSLLLGITIAAILGSNGILNPAVAFGIGSFNVMYLFGPIIGSVLGMQLFKWIGNN